MCALEEFARVHGSLRGIKEPLRSFFAQARKAHKAGRLRPEQIVRLEKVSLGWKFDRKMVEPGYASISEMRYAQVRAFVEKCGPEVPSVNGWKNKTLAHWVRGQISRWERLSEPERQRLIALNLRPELSRPLDWEKKYDRALDWAIKDRHRKWRQRFEEVRKLHERLGPYRHVTYQKANRTFAGWLRAQINKWNQLSPEQQQCLTELQVGEPVDRQDAWQKKYGQAKAIQEQHHPRYPGGLRHL